MRKSTFVFLSWLMLSAVTQQPRTVFADDTIANNRADIANGQTIYNEGNGDTAGCGDCHGNKGLGIDAKEAPRLANIGQIYAIKQLDDYALGKRIDPGVGAVMNDIARMLSDQDRLDVSAYLDSLQYETEPSNLKALAAKGIRIGDPKNGRLIMARGIKPLVPPCKDCHGMSGRAQNIGAIHQQKYVYLVNQLKRYRDGHRVNDQTVNNVGIMRGISRHLTDENIADIAAYLSTASNSAP